MKKRAFIIIVSIFMLISVSTFSTPAISVSNITGPFESLVLMNAMVIDGAGSEPFGPVDILIRGSTIDRIEASPAVFRNLAEQRYDMDGCYLSPGYIDMHVHIADARFGVPAEYQYLLWLAHGITTVRDAGCFGMDSAWWIEQKHLSEENAITAPRIFAYLRANNLQRVEDAFRSGFDGIKMTSVNDGDTVAAILHAAHSYGLRTMSHNTTPFPISILAEAGLDTMEHWYGLPEALSEGKLRMEYVDVYQGRDEQAYFRYCGTVWRKAAMYGRDNWESVAAALKELELTLVPTLSVYAACSDLERARTSSWHEEFTLPALWKSFGANRNQHASHWYDWTSFDELSWKENLDIWYDFLLLYQKIGGNISIGTDCGFMYSVFGFSYIQHLEMMLEAGFSAIETMKCATSNGAEALGYGEVLGTIEEGKIADLVIYAYNPLEDFKPLYAVGKVVLADDDSLETKYGIVATMKDGIAYGREYLVNEIKRIVRDAK